MWRIADADSEIWLFGSVHALDPDLDWRTPRIEAAFDGAEELIVETNVEDAAAFDALYRSLGALPAGETLSARIGAERWVQFERVARAKGVDPNPMQTLRPWLAAVTLSYAAMAQEGHAPEAGADATFLRDAREDGKRVSAFDSPEVQLRALADLPPEAEADFLAATLTQIEEETEDFAEIDAAWARGDTETLARMLEPEMRRGGEALYESLMTRRNARWADEIARRLDGSGDLFIAVGAAHLVGDDSVIALLRARGITVEGP